MSRHAMPLAFVTGVLAVGLPALAEDAAGRAQERYVRLSASEALRVRDAGTGEAVVLVPGHFGSAFAFRLVLPRLIAAGYRVVVVEPLGFGGSSRPEAADYSLTAQADRLNRVLDELGVERAVVVGHAIAGSIAMRLAYRHPRRVVAVVSLDGGPAETATTPAFRRAMRLVPFFGPAATLNRIRASVRSSLVTRSAHAGWVTEDAIDGYMEAASADLGATLAAYRGMARAREPEPIAPHLRDLACPVRLVIGGVTHEGGPSPEQLRVLRESLPSLVIEIVPGVGHFLFEEDPAAFVAVVERARAAAHGPAAVARR